MSIYLGKKEVSSYIHTSGDPEIVVEKPKLQDITTDGRTSLIKPGEGYNGISRVFIDNDDLKLAERNLGIILSETTVDLFYDIHSAYFRDFLFYSRTNLRKIYSKTADSIHNDALYNLLDLEELDMPNCESIMYNGVRNSYRILDANLPKVRRLDNRAFIDSFYHPTRSLKSKLSLGHIEWMGTEVFKGCAGLGEIKIGDANTNDFVRDYNNHAIYYVPYSETFETLPDGVFKDCTSLTALIMPEVHGIYTLEGSLFTTTPTDFKIYVDESKLAEYKAAWPDYSSRIQPLESHPSYNYTFEFYEDRDCYKITRYGEYANATEANALSITTPRSYKGRLPILDLDLFTNCYFDKLKIGSGTFGLYNCFTGSTIKTLEFEDFFRIHEIKDGTFNYLNAENVILNCNLTDYFNHIKTDDIGYFYNDEGIGSRASILSSPWNAQHIYTYPEFEITDMFIPAEPFKDNGMLPWGSMSGAHFNNIYLNRNINMIWNYAFENAHNTKIYIPREVETVKQHAFYGIYNTELFIEAEEKPDGWEYGWDKDFASSNVTVHWGSQM